MMRNIIVLLSVIYIALQVSTADNGLIEPLAEVEISGDYRDIVVRGRYAYASNVWGLVVMDISDQDHPPEVIRRIPTEGKAEDLLLVDSLLFLCDADSGLRIYSLADPTNPVEIGHYVTDESIGKVIVHDTLAFACEGVEMSYYYRVRILDISDNRQPRLLSTISARNIATFTQLFVLENYVYLAYGSLMEIYDISQPNRPRFVNRTIMPFLGFSSHSALQCDTLIYVSGRVPGPDALFVISLADPESPDSVGGFYNDHLITSFQIRLKIDDYLYLASSTVLHGYMQVIDVSDPHDPSIVATLDNWGNLRQRYPEPGGMAATESRLYVADGVGVVSLFQIERPQDPEFVTQLVEGRLITRTVAINGYVYFNDEGIVRQIFPPNERWLFATKLKTYNLDNPLEPELTSSLDSLGEEWTDFLLVEPDYLLAIVDRKFLVLSLENPSQPRLVGRIDGFRGPGTIVQYNEYIYISDYYANEIVIVDFTEPENPQLIGEVQAQFPGRVVNMTVSGEYLYTNETRNLGVYSLVSPEEPEFINSIEDIHLGNSIHAWNNYLYAGSHIYSLEEPAIPRLVGNFIVTIGSRFHEGLLFSSWYDHGVYVYSLDNPEDPEEIARFDTHGYASEVAVDGDLLCIADSYSMRVCDISRLRVFNDLRLSRGFHNFGPVPVGSSEEWDLTITNQGWSDHQIDSLTLADSTLYEVFVAPFEASFELLPQADTILSIEFIPLENRRYETQLQIYCGNAVLQVKIMGHGVLSRSVSEKEVPIYFGLKGVYPNPFNSTTTIRYGLPYPSCVSLQVYNPLGQRIITLFEGYRQAGFHSSNLSVNGLPSGLYFIRLETSGQVLSREITLIK